MFALVIRDLQLGEPSMRFLTRLAARLAHAVCRLPASSVDRDHANRSLREHGRASATGYARSPTYVELDRRPGQVNWLVARAVTLQYR